MKTRRFAFSALCLLLTPLFARAEILTYVTQGRVTQITDPLGLLDFVQLDDTVTYRGTFDTRQAGSHPFPGYSTYSGLSSFLRVGSRDFTAEPPVMAIGHPLDLVDMESHFSTTLPGLLPQGSAKFVLSQVPRPEGVA